jgi:hypothetical protein
MESSEGSLAALTELSREALVERVRELEAKLHETQEKLAEAQAFIAELERQLFGPKAEKLSAEQEKPPTFGRKPANLPRSFSRCWKKNSGHGEGHVLDILCRWRWRLKRSP